MLRLPLVVALAWNSNLLFPTLYKSETRFDPGAVLSAIEIPALALGAVFWEVTNCTLMSYTLVALVSFIIWHLSLDCCTPVPEPLTV